MQIIARRRQFDRFWGGTQIDALRTRLKVVVLLLASWNVAWADHRPTAHLLEQNQFSILPTSAYSNVTNDAWSVSGSAVLATNAMSLPNYFSKQVPDVKGQFAGYWDDRPELDNAIRTNPGPVILMLDIEAPFGVEDLGNHVVPDAAGGYRKSDDMDYSGTVNNFDMIAQALRTRIEAVQSFWGPVRGTRTFVTK